MLVPPFKYLAGVPPFRDVSSLSLGHPVRLHGVVFYMANAVGIDRLFSGLQSIPVKQFELKLVIKRGKAAVQASQSGIDH